MPSFKVMVLRLFYNEIFRLSTRLYPQRPLWYNENKRRKGETGVQGFFDWLAAEKHIALSPQQRAAVEQTRGPGLLVATPGSGKTTVIVCRTACLLRVHGVPASRILTLTFGKHSQLDMDRRFASLFPELPKPRFSTIHALCLDILRTYSELSGREMFQLRQDCTALVRGLLAQQLHGFVDEETLQAALSGLDRVCNTMQPPERCAHPDDGFDLKQLHEDYRRAKRERRVMDFGDLLTFAHRALTVVPPLLQRFRDACDYIQIDEAQDTSPIQQRICDLLAGPGGNLFLVGDEDQSIYGFRGAAPDYLMNFEHTHPGARVLYMETNYRSCPEIVDAGSRIIQYNANRRQKRMTAARSDRGVVESCALRDWSAQGAEIARRARELPPGRTLGVLCRNNDSLPALVFALQRAGVPFTVSRKDGRPPLFSHYALRNLRSLIRLSFNPCDGEAFYDLRNRIRRDIPPYIAKQVRDSGENVFEQLASRLRLAGSDLAALERKARQVASYKTMRAYPAVCAMVEDFHLDNHGAARAKTDALMTLAMDAETLDHFTARLHELELLFDADPPRGGSVFLTTIHAAKGLEYDEVILADVRRGILPADDADGTPEQRAALEEETRLMYVAVTRARQRCTVLTATTSHGVPAPASVYVDRLFPPPGARRPSAAPPLRVNRGKSAAPAPKPVKAEDYSVWTGRRVRHRRFGEGRVIAVRGSVATVRFPDGERALDLSACLSGGLLTALRG